RRALSVYVCTATCHYSRSTEPRCQAGSRKKYCNFILHSCTARAATGSTGRGRTMIECARRSAARSLRLLLRKQLTDDVDRHREDDGRGLVAGDLGERLQVAQLHRLRALREHGGGLQQLFGGLQLAFGVDHLGAALALGLGLARDGTHHRLVQVDVLDLDVGDLDARDDDDQAGAPDRLEAAEQEHHRALVLAVDLDREKQQDDDENDRAEAEVDHGSISTVRTRPSIAATRRRWPRLTGCAARTRHLSPCTRAQPSPSKSSSASPAAPIISSRPLTTGRLRARSSMPTTKTRN